MTRKIYLYVKTHNKTGLKYFGKTIQNPFEYYGSGVFWKRHIKKYGNDVTTEIVGEFVNEEECRNVAIDFSITHNIVESKDWANLKLETLDGGWDHITREHILKGIETFRKRPVEEQQQINKSKGQQGNKNYWFGKDRSGDKNPRFGAEISEEQRKKQREKMKGKTYGIDEFGKFHHVKCNDARFKTGELLRPRIGKIVVKDTFGNISSVDVNDDRFLSGELIHINKGRKLNEETKKKLSKIVSETRWFNDGKVSIRRNEPPGDRWIPGRIKKHKQST